MTVKSLGSFIETAPVPARMYLCTTVYVQFTVIVPQCFYLGWTTVLQILPFAIFFGREPTTLQLDLNYYVKH